MSSLEPALVDLAVAQGGAFAAHQAHPLGVTDAQLSRAVSSGALRRVRRGAYVVTSLVAPQTPEGAYRAGVTAVLLSRGRRTWASHHAAVALFDLPLVGVDLSIIDVCAPVSRTFTRNGLTTHALPDGEQVFVVRGSRTVSLGTALVQTAGRSFKAGVVAADAALAQGLVEADTLLSSEAGRVLAAATDAAAESPGESLTRLLLTGLGWPVRSQVRIHDEHGLVGRVDFLVGTNVVVEFDGMVKYEGAGGRTALAAEKRREDRLRAAGYQVVRVVWADLAHPDRVARLVRQAAQRAGLAGIPR